MIGIIGNAFDAFSIVERIRKKYSKINIYIYGKKFKIIEEAIKKLIEKGCRIIILPKEYEKLKSTENVSFLILNDTPKKDCYVIDDYKLIEAIDKGNKEEIEKRLKKLKEIPYQKIQLNHPKLLYIKKMIEEVTEKEVIDNLDDLLEKIDNIIKTNKYNVLEDKIVNIIN